MNAVAYDSFSQTQSIAYVLKSGYKLKPSPDPVPKSLKKDSPAVLFITSKARFIWVKAQNLFFLYLKNEIVVKTYKLQIYTIIKKIFIINSYS